MASMRGQEKAKAKAPRADWKEPQTSGRYRDSDLSSASNENLGQTSNQHISLLQREVGTPWRLPAFI